MMTATDVITVQRAKAILELAPSDTTRDQLVQEHVSSISNWLDWACGPIVQRQVTDVLDGGISTIRTTFGPISSPAITEYVAGVGTALAAETLTAAGDYRLTPWRRDPVGLYGSMIERRSGWNSSCWAGRVQVIYTAGRYPTTLHVEGTRFHAAARMMLGWSWSQHQLGQGQAGGYDVPVPSFPLSMPRAIREVLGEDYLVAVPLG